MQMMLDANIIATFVGIESPNEASLRETKKFQNVRSGGTMLEKVHRIQDAGIEVWCGMIMGFDNDDETIFDAQIEFVREARIAHSMSGMLYAIAKTPLHARLAAEGRLDPADQPEFGTNVIPLKVSREELRDGYVKVMNELYTPEAYFGRLEDLWINGNFDIGTSRAKYWKKHPFQRLKMESIWLAQAVGLFFRFMTMIPEAHLRERISPEGLALPQAPPEPGDGLHLHGQDRPALPRPHDGHPDEVGGDEGLQFVLRRKTRSS